MKISAQKPTMVPHSSQDKVQNLLDDYMNSTLTFLCSCEGTLTGAR